MILLLGAFINLYLICNVIIRPAVWSTGNTFLCFFLSLNAFHLLVQIYLSSRKIFPTADNDLLQALDYLYYDSRTAKICSAQNIIGHLHHTSTVNVLLGILVIRLMMINYAENIKTENMLRKSYQARLSTIGILVSVQILTFLVITFLIMMLFPLFPYDFVLVKHCRGVPLSYSLEERQKITKGWLIRLSLMILMLLLTLFCQLRIFLTKRSRHSSNFSNKRQNIATLDQTLFAAHLKLFLAILYEIHFNLLIENSPSGKYIAELDLTRDILNCVLLPGYWVYSTKQQFPELWAQVSRCRNTSRIPTKPSSFDTLSVMEPRRPVQKESSFIMDPSTQESMQGRFFNKSINEKIDGGHDIFRSFYSITNENSEADLVQEESKQDLVEGLPGKFSYGLQLRNSRESCQVRTCSRKVMVSFQPSIYFLDNFL